MTGDGDTLASRPSLPLQLRRYAQHFTQEERDDHAFGWPDGGPDVWGERCCGLACVRMLLDHFALAVPSQRHLLAQGLELGAYTPKGWHHQGLVNLADGLGLSGVAAHFDSPEPLQRLAQEGIPAIVSCTFTFPEDGRRGGHLVLFRGERIQLGQRVAGFADPSRWGALHDELPAERFWASWTGRAIILRPSVQASPGFGGTADLSKWIDDITTQAGVNR